MAHQTADTPDLDPRDPSEVALRAFVRARRRKDRAAMSEEWRRLLTVEWPRVLIMVARKRHDSLPGGRVPVDDRDEIAHRAYLRLHDWLELEGSSIGEVRAIIRKAVNWSFLDHVGEHVEDDMRRAGSFDEVDDSGEGPSAFVRAVEDELAERLGNTGGEPVIGRRISEALDDVTENRRKIVVLRLSGYTSKEVAEHMDLTPANVDQRFSRGLAELRTALEEWR